MSEKNLRLLAFDFGIKRIGVASGQTLTKSAQGLATIPAKNGSPQWEMIDMIVKKWQPDGLIVGIPLNMDGTEQTITHSARHFANSLRKRYDVLVYECDERLTTKDAREQLFKQGGFKALQAGTVDQMAAKLILENWLNDKDHS